MWLPLESVCPHFFKTILTDSVAMDTCLEDFYSTESSKMPLQGFSGFVWVKKSVHCVL